MGYTEYAIEIKETVNMPEVILQSMFSRVLTFNGWPGWLNANGYNYAMLYWASEASPTLGCSIEYSRDIYSLLVEYV